MSFDVLPAGSGRRTDDDRRIDEAGPAAESTVPGEGVAVWATEPAGWLTPRRILVLQVLLVVLLLAARWVAHATAGALWRDEVFSVDLASSRGHDLFYDLTNDSAPVMWQVLLRGWIALFGNTDRATRMLGMLIGLSVLPAAWWALRQFGVSFPWWTFVLLGLDPTMVIFGGEVRHYGLGVVTLLLLIGSSWHTLQRPTTGRWAELTALSLLAVQSSFSNCFLLAAAFIACGVVALRRRQPRVIVGFLLIGLVAAASMLPYALYVFPRFVGAIHPYASPVPWTNRLAVFVGTFAWAGFARTFLWPALGIFVLFKMSQTLFARSTGELPPSDAVFDRLLFLLTFGIVGTITFWAYVNFLGVISQSWNYLPYLTLLAVTTDLAWNLPWASSPRRQQTITVLAATVMALVLAVEVGPRLYYRLTSINLIARTLSHDAQPGDLIVVTPWYLGISFNRYYHGPAEWMNFPSIDLNRQHDGYRELTEQVMTRPPEEAVHAELERMKAVINAGHNIWWIGQRPLNFQMIKKPIKVTAAPDPVHGWNQTAYQLAWEKLALQALRSVRARITPLDYARPKAINSQEDPQIHFFYKSQPQQHPTDPEGSN